MNLIEYVIIWFIDITDETFMDLSLVKQQNCAAARDSFNYLIFMCFPYSGTAAKYTWRGKTCLDGGR